VKTACSTALAFFASLALLAAGESKATSPGLKADREHWAFKAPQRSALPKVKDGRWVRNPIDAFILARLEKERIKPSPEAERVTLIRRLSLDLLGLPPAPEEIHEFAADKAPDAYERLVDRLLASPHFGERWGRHWLDLARYADSDGYEKDAVRPYAYLYRDWVIDAINRDEPFDEFTIEQLAGDLLPAATLEQKKATGFHRQTLTNKEGGVDPEEFRCKATVDRVSTTASVWLGLTLGCAECHSHKYDPITQREFYQFYAFFNTASEVDVPAPLPEELARYEKEKRAWDEEEARLKEAREAHLKEDGDEAQSSWDKQLAAHAKKEPKAPDRKAATLAENEKRRETRIHLRGDFLRKGDLVSPGTLAVLHPFKPRGDRPDRLDLAHWLMDPANPLTSRVTVNRIWRHLLGRGLTDSVDDFGARGELPSHPELLDWLATEFPKRGWSLKRMIKLIVTSSTYRQSSHFRPELLERDPGNVLLARQNRFHIEAENVRDVYLAASGLLNPAIGGPSVRPPLPADIAAIGYANSVKWKESAGADRYRRGLYIFFQRTVPYPMLITFDAPAANLACTRRERSNTPLQALTLLNDPVFYECAQALGRQLAGEPFPDVPARIKRAFERCLGREPTRAESVRLQTFYEGQLRLTGANPGDAARIVNDPKIEASRVPETAALVALARTLMNLDEFVTRE
jgi:hypothetical protein